MKKNYISIDIEATWQTPVKHSLVSIGAINILKPEFQFYAEIKPQTKEFSKRAMNIVRRWLIYLTPAERKKNTFYLHNKYLQENGKNIDQVLQEFTDWVSSQVNNITDFRDYTFAAWPASFDAAFVQSAFWMAGKDYPFPFSWHCFSTQKRLRWKPDKKIDKKDVYNVLNHSDIGKRIVIAGVTEHNALYDAVYQSMELYNL